MPLRAVAVLFAFFAAAAACAQPTFDPGLPQGSLNSNALDEVSGLAASRLNPGVIWCHNDSGDSARVFAIDTQARLLGAYGLSGVTAIDFEDIASGPGPSPGVPYLYIADIGDNLFIRGTVRLYRVPEPSVSLGQAVAPISTTLGGIASFTLDYGATSYNAETLLIDPTTGDLFIATKEAGSARIFTATAAQLAVPSTIVLTQVATVPLLGASRLATGGDFSPDGRLIIIRGTNFALLFTRGTGQSVAAALSAPPTVCPVIGPPTEPQGEAVCFDAAAHGYFTLSEGEFSPLYYFPRRCLADFNGTGGVTVQDIYDFLLAWQSSLTIADFNGSPPAAAGVSVQDIYDFLLAWNAGCQ